MCTEDSRFLVQTVSRNSRKEELKLTFLSHERNVTKHTTFRQFNQFPFPSRKLEKWGFFPI